MTKHHYSLHLKIIRYNTNRRYNLKSLKTLLQRKPHQSFKPKNSLKGARNIEYVVRIGNTTIIFKNLKTAKEIVDDIINLSQNCPKVSLTKRGYFGKFMSEEVICNLN